MKTRSEWIIAMAVGAVTSGAVAQPTLTHLTGFRPRVFNADGSVLASMDNYHTYRVIPQPFLWIGSIGQITAAQAMSADGSAIVGTSGQHGFYWTEATGIVNVGLLPPDQGQFNVTEAVTVSANGQVVAGRSNYMPFRWTSSGGMAPLPLPAGDSWGGGMCISSDGSVIAGYTIGSVPARACRWVGGVHAPIDGLGSVYRSFSIDVSGDGRTLVGHVVPVETQFNDNILPFRWVEGEGIEYLPLPPACSYAMVLSVSSDGNLVYGSGSLTAQLHPYYSEPFVWTPTLGTVGLAEQLQRMGVDLNGLTIAGARMSKDGTAMLFGTTHQTETTQFYLLRNLPPFDCGPADRGHAGGLSGGDGRLDNNDFIAFIDLFFEADPRADLGKAGGLRGSDGQLDNNDFIAFIDYFFTGCSR